MNKTFTTNGKDKNGKDKNDKDKNINKISNNAIGVSNAIEVSNIWKVFQLPHEKKNTFFEVVTGIFKESRYEEFVALKNINFCVKEGEAIGIIGENGSGKSTLLKIIANILRANKGSIKIKGKITPFLELGVGFQADLTVKENIYVYGAVMGLSDKDIDSKIDEILNFSGLKRFEDAKLKNLSSGMQVRLAFATAIQTDPGILLMDEVLAVGDIEFQQKCIDVFQKYLEAKKTIVFVSHDLNSVRRFCHKALLLKHGEQIAFGDTNDIIDKYVYGINNGKENDGKINDGKENDSNGKEKGTDIKRWGDKKVEIIDVKFIDKFNKDNIKFNSGDSLIIEINYSVNTLINDDLVIGIAIYSDNNVLCYGTNTYIQKYVPCSSLGDNKIKLLIHSLTMMEGKYYLTIAAHDKLHRPYDWLDKQFSFDVIKKGNDAGLFNIPCEWR